ncbi:hypothetical protein BH11GEM1_BH11GEM1_30510 [soil metagenome]
MLRNVLAKGKSLPRSPMYSYTTIITLIAILLACAHPSAYAQRGSAQIEGTVVERISGAAVASAVIVHLGAGTTVSSDSLGRFVLTEMAPGIVRLLIRARGFPATIVNLALARGEQYTRMFELDSSTTAREATQQLQAAATVATLAPLPRYADFERRRHTGRGQYLLGEDLEKAGYSTLQDAMRGLRGVNVECGGGNGCAIRMARAPLRCIPEYIVDERVDNIFGASTPIRDIEGIEVYTGPSDVPGEFAGRNAGCGVVVIWTHAGPRKKH